MNQGLVKGAALVGQSKRSNWAEAMQQGLNSSLQAAAINRSKQIAKKQKINATVAGYIDGLNSEIDLTQLTGEQQGAVTNFLVENKNTYARAASEIAKIDDATDPRYMELREQMNGVQNSFKNLAGQVNAFKEDKIAYLKDFDDRRISDGNGIGSLASAAKIYTDQGNIGVGKGGNLNFWDADKEEYTNYANVQKPFLKDFKSANNILSLNESVYSAGSSLSGARQNMIRNKLKNMISSGGRDTLLSLASDDFLIEGGLNLSDPSLFDPANQDLLQDAVLNSYMDALSDTAAQGARDKKPARGKGSGGFSGALQDEINLSGPVVNKAMQFSEISQMPEGGDKASSVVQYINSIDPTAKERPYVSRNYMFKEFMEEMDYDDDEVEEAQEDFTNNYGNFQVFKFNPGNVGDSRGINIDINNPQALYEFYIKNSNLSGKATNYHLGNWNKYNKSTQQEQEPTQSETSTSNFG